MDRNSAARSIQEFIELRSHDGTESDAGLVEAVRVPEARRRAAVARVADPAAAAQQTGRTSSGSCGVGLVSWWIRTPQILTPLPNIAQRVIKSECVGEFRRNSARLFA